ncbi:hypothetical protein MKK67_06740 [Methylobacterium sp. J-072]|uniref:hypothetical protein n=1 Tax=Methylobacterium sp. J-072 TaxID=2836651 RepID=UPI001FB942AA|nr:hypothetical protein [Methylobacterium sp. J-072]MCJ2092193.1 hypothetical protein [Methylobacterium sp. J-072]
MDESVLDTPPTKLYPKHAFIMRQLGEPAQIDEDINKLVKKVFKSRGFSTVDATSSVGAKDFLSRILSLIRGTGFTVAIFSEDTRPRSLANIALELGFAAMCGKPLLIVKSAKAEAPSDLKRTDWLVYDPNNTAEFTATLKLALDEIESYAEFESVGLEVAINGNNTDCAVAFERANKAFLLSGDPKFIKSAEDIIRKLEGFPEDIKISDIDRLRDEINTFILQAARAVDVASSKKSTPKSSPKSSKTGDQNGKISAGNHSAD